MEMWVLWLILTVVFAVIEAATLGLTTVWCAIGSAVAAVMAMFGAPVPAQLITMIAVSVVCFIICMIWIKPKLDAKHKLAEPTNADRVIGQTWSAKANKAIAEGTKVKVTALEGVKIIVEEIV